MNNESCDPIKRMLVSFADEELAPADARRVEAHLAECPRCRAELRLLVDSLQLARSVWEELAAAPGEKTPAATRRIGRPTNVRWSAAVAFAGACAVVAALFLAILFGPWHQNQSLPPPQDQVAIDANVQQPAVSLADEDFNVELYISRTSRAAKLAATIELLAAEPEMKEYKDQTERYLAQNFGDALVGVQSNQATSPKPKEPEL
jgi:predicted anti-sigma-YlaC factor YlaD